MCYYIRFHGEVNLFLECEFALFVEHRSYWLFTEDWEESRCEVAEVLRDRKSAAKSG